MRLNLCVLALLLVAASAAGGARADGLPVLGVDAGGDGLVAAGGEERYVTLPAGRDTVLARVGTADGKVLASRLLPGTFTIPAVAYDGSAAGLSADGRTLALIEPRAGFPRATTRLLILDPRRPARRELVRLTGDFSFDAISPHGSLLYLIQYVAPADPLNYRVRAYDLRAGRLLARPVTDPREADEEMRGVPVTRVGGPGGRWAYTLYDRPGGAPFVHALDTAGRTARCVDLDGLAGGNTSSLRLGLDAAGRTLSVLGRGRTLAAIDLRTFAVTAPVADVGRPAEPAESAAPAEPGLPWTPIALSSGGAALAAGAVALSLLRRRRRRLAPTG